MRLTRHLTSCSRSFTYDHKPPHAVKETDRYTFLPKAIDLQALQQQQHSKPNDRRRVNRVVVAKPYVISMLTSETNPSKKHTIKIVLRGERGLTSMLSLQHSSWNQLPFQSKQKDKFLLLAADVGKV